jgi:hypothetical protein
MKIWITIGWAVSLVLVCVAWYRVGYQRGRTHNQRKGIRRLKKGNAIIRSVMQRVN